MKNIFICIIMLAISNFTYSQEDITENLKGIKSLAVTVSQTGNLVDNVEHSIKMIVESKLIDNNIKVLDNYNTSKYRLSVNIITHSLEEGYFVMIFIDLLEQAKLKRLNKEFYCRTYNDLLTVVAYNNNISKEIKELVNDLMDNIIHELKKDNQL